MMQEKIVLASKPIANPAYASREDELGWTALVNLDIAAGVALNETGLLVWQTIDGTKTMADIIAEVKKHFSDAPPTIEQDLLAILETLRDAGLIGFEVNL